MADRAAIELEAALAPYVPDLLRAWPDDVAWQQLEGTMVSADISGFTTLAERLAERGREGAEELNQLISGCFEGMIEHCDRHGGDVVKFGGDALLVWFAGEGHATRACRAAVGMRSTSAGDVRHPTAGSSAWPCRSACTPVSITSSPSTSGATISSSVARRRRRRWPAESAAAAGEILLSDSTAALVPASWLGAARPDGVTLQRLTASHRRPTQPPDVTSTMRASSAFVSEVQQAQVMAGAVHEHRQVAVSFIAFSGTDALVASGGADELAVRLRAASASIASICERFGVFLLATDVNRDGGKFMLAAGAPLSRGGDDERMLRAAARSSTPTLASACAPASPVAMCSAATSARSGAACTR